MVAGAVVVLVVDAVEAVVAVDSVVAVPVAGVEDVVVVDVVSSTTFGASAAGFVSSALLQPVATTRVAARAPSARRFTNFFIGISFFLWD